MYSSRRLHEVASEAIRVGCSHCTPRFVWRSQNKVLSVGTLCGCGPVRRYGRKVRPPTFRATKIRVSCFSKLLLYVEWFLQKYLSILHTFKDKLQYFVRGVAKMRHQHMPGNVDVFFSPQNGRANC